MERKELNEDGSVHKMGSVVGAVLEQTCSTFGGGKGRVIGVFFVSNDLLHL